MKLQEAIALIRHDKLMADKPVTWADLGSGTGLFTQALAQLIPQRSHIYAIDTDCASLHNLADLEDRVPPDRVTIKTVCQDFVQDEWPFETVDGLLMANSLHYVLDKPAFLQKAERHLTGEGCFLIVEYDTDIANPWVPYPLSYASLRSFFQKAGYTDVEKLHQMPSRYGRANLYSAFISR